MDTNRRGPPRFVVDPQFRQVGFITSCCDSNNNPNVTTSTLHKPTPDLPRPLLFAPCLPADPPRASPLPVPSPPPCKQLFVEVPVQASYNPTDSVLGNSPTLSPISNGRYTSVQSSDGIDLSPSYASRTIEGLNLKDDGRESPSAGGFAPGRELSLFKYQQQNPSSSKVSNFQAQSITETIGASKVSNLQAQSITETIPPTDKELPLKPLKERTTKAERRAKQEADREAKRTARETGSEVLDSEGGTSGGGAKPPKAPAQKKLPATEKRPPVVVEKVSEKERKKEVPAPRMQFDDEHRVAKAKKRALIELMEPTNRVELFKHLPQFVHGTQLPSLEAKFFHDDAMYPHPAVYQVGLQYLTGDCVGGNARCVAMLLAFREVIQDYSTPKEKTLVRDLMARINSNVSFLTTCRPLSISMGNAIRILKTRIGKMPPDLSEADSKFHLISEIDRFIQEKITFADKEIVKHAVSKIKDGDVILTYGSSCVVEMIILNAFEVGRQFRVVLVDSRPKFEGKGLLRRLLAKGISCTYTHINAISYIMQEVTKVFLGASSILANGTVYSRVGSACVAMVANAFHVPIMVCCETYKFHERVQLDSICTNELGDPDALVKVPGGKDLNELDGWAQSPHLQLLNLMYDAMPADYVSMIITELGMVPPTSIPVILREHRKEPMM